MPPPYIAVFWLSEQLTRETVPEEMAMAPPFPAGRIWGRGQLAKGGAGTMRASDPGVVPSKREPPCGWPACRDRREPGRGPVIAAWVLPSLIPRAVPPPRRAARAAVL